MAFKDILDRHHDCGVVIIPRFHKNRPRLIDGLYCEKHGKLIKWLSPNTCAELVNAGVEKLEPVPLDRVRIAIQSQHTQIKGARL